MKIFSREVPPKEDVMGKKLPYLLYLLILIIFLPACSASITTSEGDEKLRHFSAETECWHASMTVVTPAPPEEYFDITIEYVYTAGTADENQRVTYRHMQDWAEEEPAMVIIGDFLPTPGNPYEKTFEEREFARGYSIGQKWKTEVHWSEDGEHMIEKLVFEEEEI